MPQKLKNSDINLFCIGEMGFIIMMLLAVNYYAYFLTDVALIGAATVGTILLIARIADAVSVPITGCIIEKIDLKWGRYRSWILAAPPFIAVFFILMFTNPDVNVVTKAVLLGTFYVLGHVSVNLAGSAYVALIPVLATDQTDRVKLSSRRAQANAGAQIIFGLIAMPLILALGAGNEGRGFFLTIIIFATLQLLGYLLVARITKPFVAGRQTEGKKDAITVKDMFAQIFSNSPLLVLLLAEMFRMTTMFVLMGFGVYYFKYVAHNMLMVTAFFTSLSAAALVGAVTGQFIAKKFTKKKTYILGMVVAVLSLSAAWLVAKETLVFIIFCSLAMLGINIVQAMQAAMYADTAEYSEWKTGKNVGGLIMALSALPIKIGVAVSGAVTGFGLAAAGYVANAKPTAELASAISTLATLVPALFAVLAIVGILFYSLSEEKVNQMRLEIQTRNGEFPLT